MMLWAKSLTVILLALAALSGCTSRGWFEGMQASARLQCQKTSDAEAARRCEEDVNQRKFDQYEQDRPK